MSGGDAYHPGPLTWRQGPCGGRVLPTAVRRCTPPPQHDPNEHDHFSMARTPAVLRSVWVYSVPVVSRMRTGSACGRVLASPGGVAAPCPLIAGLCGFPLRQWRSVVPARRRIAARPPGVPGQWRLIASGPLWRMTERTAMATMMASSA